MNSESNKWWLFWTVTAVLGALLVFSFTGFPVSLAKKEPPPQTSPVLVKTNKFGHVPPGQIRKMKKLIDAGQQELTDAEKLILFTQKSVCRRNVQTINTMVEFWHVREDGLWPREDLSDIGRNKDYFPSGVPRCPLDNSPYRLDPVSHRVLGHEHADIQLNYKDIPGFKYYVEQAPEKNTNNNAPKRDAGTDKKNAPDKIR